MEFLEMAQTVDSLYVSKTIDEKARLLNILLSNRTLMDVSLYPTFKKPFDLVVEGASKNIKLDDWDSNPHNFHNILYFNKIQ